jgi:hypothetical protein
MKTFKELSEEISGTAAAKDKMKEKKKGDTLSFTHHKHGELSGKYQGMKRMGGRSYAHVEVAKHGAFYVPPHQVNH